MVNGLSYHDNEIEEMEKNNDQAGKQEQDDQSIEKTLKELESIIEKMEDRDSSLEDTFALYESGMKMVRVCSEKIEKVEKKIEILSEDGLNEEF